MEPKTQVQIYREALDEICDDVSSLLKLFTGQFVDDGDRDKIGFHASRIISGAITPKNTEYKITEEDKKELEHFRQFNNFKEVGLYLTLEISGYLKVGLLNLLTDCVSVSQVSYERGGAQLDLCLMKIKTYAGVLEQRNGNH